MLDGMHWEKFCWIFYGYVSLPSFTGVYMICVLAFDGKIKKHVPDLNVAHVA